jgi:FlaA1/EpsC-like NDP-sugar epimerase
MIRPTTQAERRNAVWPKFVCDAVLFATAFAIADFAGSGWLGGSVRVDRMLLAIAILVDVKLASLYLFGAYRCVWRYTGIECVKDLLLGASVASGVLWMVGALSGWQLFPSPSVLLLDAALGILLVSGARIAVRIGHSSFRLRKHPGPRALIVGAGDAGEMIVREMRRRVRLHFDPVGFVDDDPRKWGTRIHGIPVLGASRQIPRAVARLRVETIIIAIPSASPQTLQELVGLCRRTHADIKILPNLAELMDPNVGLSRVPSAEVQDLLGRPAVEQGEVVPDLRGRTVLVTGAGGSIGSELCRQILRFAPDTILMMGRGENSIHQAHRNLAPIAGGTRLVQVIGDVINKPKLRHVFATYRPQVVFHAGADKHVPLMEMFPDEAVLNNVIGTKNVLELADEARCEKVVCISSDKAVQPSSVMGSTKRVAELLVRSPLFPNTRAVAVRFGNVFGSRGSVIPQFQDQIANGGPLTVTDKHMSRYFMTIPEAVRLVLVAGAMGRGREIFVLDMGAPVRIWDLAAGMARLRGLTPGVDIEVKETGLRPGEKLHEQLFLQGEEREPTEHPRITRTHDGGVNPEWLLNRIDALRDLALRVDFDGIRDELARIVEQGEPRVRGAREEAEARETGRKAAVGRRNPVEAFGSA